MIQIRDLGFSYSGNKVLENISMDLKEGHIYGLLGGNGVGKTTLLTLICGLKKPQSGKIDIDGHAPMTESRHCCLKSITSAMKSQPQT